MHRTKRQYHRHTRKAACSYCSSQHLRCRTPDSPRAAGDQQPRRCKACEDNDAVCVRPQLLTGRSSRSFTAASTASTAPPSGSVGIDIQGICTDGASPALVSSPTAPLTLNTPPTHHVSMRSSHTSGREGSEMLFVRLVESSKDGPANNDGHSGDRVICFGEHSSWTFTIQERRGPGTSRSSPGDSSSSGASIAHEPAQISKGSGSPSIASSGTPSVHNTHYSIPDTMDDCAHDLPKGDFDASGEEEALLRKKGAFTLPPKDLQDALLAAYFRWLHPALFLFDRQNFMQRFAKGRSSLLLLQSIFFVATIYVDNDVIHAHNSSRQGLEILFFKRAKALYESEYESDPITIIQALYLMSFWWESPTERKDIGHWLGAAISLAQARGLHRSTKHSNIRLKDRRLWKRLWWALYARDRSDSAALGRPMRIHDDDCDVELLEETDFDNESSLDDSIQVGPTRQIHHLYTIEMAKLSVLLGMIIKPKFNIQGTSSVDHRMLELTEKLEEWELHLPQEIRYDENNPCAEARYWSGMLQITYCKCLILLHRSVFLTNPSANNEGHYAVAGARKITRIVEDLLLEGLVSVAQVLLVPSLFAACTVHFTLMRRKSGIPAKLAENQLRICLMGLTEMKDAWPVTGWILRLFDHITKPPPNEGSTNGNMTPSRSVKSRTQRQDLECQQNLLQQHEQLQPSNNADSFHQGSVMNEACPMPNQVPESPCQQENMFTFGPGLYSTMWTHFNYSDSPFWPQMNIPFGLGEHSSSVEFDPSSIPCGNYEGQEQQYPEDMSTLGM